MIEKHLHRSNGFSLVEIILAVALFVIFSSGLVTLVLHSYSASRLGGEETLATQYATEGIEAVKSIKNQAYSNLVNSAAVGVIRNVSNVWQFSGTNNVYGKYSRILKVEDVYRDVSKNIVTVGGTLDSDTKKVTSTVSWDFTSGRNNSVELISYLTNFRKSIASPDNGLVLYADSVTNSTYPRIRNYTDSSNTFSAESQLPVGSLGRNFVVRTSPVKREAIAGYTDNTGNLKVMCFDGSSWTQDWTIAVGGTGTTRRFDMAYETNSGDVLVIYSTNSGTNELAYRTKLGSQSCGSVNWSNATTFDSLGTTGTVQWIKTAWDKRSSSNLITAIWADSNQDLQAANWSGSAWTQRVSALETTLEIVSTAQDVDDFDVEYESTSGDIMVVWANSAGSNAINGVRYSTCTGGIVSCTWSAVTTPPTFLDDATNLDISANPNTNEIVFASIGNAGSDLQYGYWSGSAWTNLANRDTACATPLAGTKLVATGWLISGSTTRSIIVYNDSAATNLGWYVGNGSTFSAQTDWVPSPLFANPQKWYDIQTDPINKDRLMLSLSDNANDVVSKRLVMSSVPAFTWTNSNGVAALGLNLAQSTGQPFSFAYWRY